LTVYDSTSRGKYNFSYTLVNISSDEVVEINHAPLTDDNLESDYEAIDETIPDNIKHQVKTIFKLVQLF